MKWESCSLQLAGTQSVSVVLFQVQTHFQKNVLQLYHEADKLSYVCLFHECFVNATCVDLVTAVCSSLRRHLSRVHCISKYQDFTYSPDGNKKKITKSIYFVTFHSSFTTGSIEVISPCIEYSETWLCNSTVPTPKIHEESKWIPEVFRFRLHTNTVPVQTTLGVTDRSCISFCISPMNADYSSSSLEQIYQLLRNETDNCDKQELQRIIPLLWVGSQHAVPSFFLHQFVTFVDCRRYSKQPHSIALCKIQEILLSMDIADAPFSNIHVKENRIDHHVISQIKGSNQSAKLSAFLPIRRNDLSRKRFNRVKQSNFRTTFLLFNSRLVERTSKEG